MIRTHTVHIQLFATWTHTHSRNATMYNKKRCLYATQTHIQTANLQEQKLRSKCASTSAFAHTKSKSSENRHAIQETRFWYFNISAETIVSAYTKAWNHDNDNKMTRARLRVTENNFTGTSMGLTTSSHINVLSRSSRRGPLCSKLYRYLFIPPWCFTNSLNQTNTRASLTLWLTIDASWPTQECANRVHTITTNYAIKYTFASGQCRSKVRALPEQ